MDYIENRGRGKVMDRKDDLGAILLGIRTGEYKPTHYLKGVLIRGGMINEKRVPRGAGRGRGSGPMVLTLTQKGSAHANLHLARQKKAKAKA